MIKELISDSKKRMDKAMDDFQKELQSIRTGRASVSLLDHIFANYYGTPTPIAQMATLTVPEPSMIVIQPWDASTIKDIEKAILASDLGITPSNDGKVIRLPVPALTEDRRKQLAKQVMSVAESHRIAIRLVRHETNDRAKKSLKDKKISEDEEKEILKKVQDQTDQHIRSIDQLAEKKQQELLKM
jgi:ribosome recycling factor